jgi:hypothetical protein
MAEEKYSQKQFSAMNRATGGAMRENRRPPSAQSTPILPPISINANDHE